MTRYWTDDATGTLYARDDTWQPADVVGPWAMTEVQVVTLDAIVIEPVDLPEVRVDEHGAFHVDGKYADPGMYADPSFFRVADSDYYRRQALASLALEARLRRHYAEHPPVDEEKVRLVSSAIRAAHAIDSSGRLDYDATARVIVAHSLINVTKDEDR